MSLAKSVIILLSTYNGSSFLNTQLQSFAKQLYWQNCTLFVRDDGSTDETVQILKQFAKENAGKVIITEGKNIGFVKSFFWLLQNAPKADYYSFADQDDLWQQDKISASVNALNKCDNTVPQLYFCDFDFYDAELRFVARRTTSKKKPTFYESLTDCRAAGFSIVINDTMRCLAQKADADKIFYHDYFLYTLSFCTGEPIYERKSYIKYRRHGKNESRSILEKTRLLKWRVKNFLFKTDTKFASSFRALLELPMQMQKEHKATLELFCAPKTFKNQCKKVFFAKRLRQKLLDELALRTLFLIGKM